MALLMKLVVCLAILIIPIDCSLNGFSSRSSIFERIWNSDQVGAVVETSHRRRLSTRQDSLITLVEKNCPNAKIGDKASFNEYIHRGSISSWRSISGLSPEESDSDTIAKALLRKGIDYKTTLTESKFIRVWASVFILWIILLIVVLVASCLGCCSCCRSCLGFCVCRSCCVDRERKHTVASVARSKFWFLTVFSVIILFVVYLTFSVLALSYSSGISQASDGLQCQVSRFLLDLEDGVQYEQSPNETFWLQTPLPSTAVFSGLTGVEARVKEIEDEAASVSPEALLVRFGAIVDQSAGDTRQDILRAEETLEEIKLGHLKVSKPELRLQLLLGTALNSEKSQDLPEKLDKAKADIDQASADAKQKIANVKSLLETSAAQGREQKGDVDSGVDDAMTEVNRVLAPKEGEEEITSILIERVDLPFYIISSLFLIGLLWVIGLFTTLQLYHAKGKEPRLRLMACCFRGLCCWFCISGIIFSLLGVIILLVVALGGQGCDVVHSIVEDPSVMKSYSLMETLYTGGVAKASDTCLAKNATGDLINAFAGDKKKEVDDQITNLESSLLGELQENPDEETLDKIDNYNKIISNARGSLLIDLEFYKDDATHENYIFLEEAILLSGLHSSGERSVSLAGDDFAGIREALQRDLTDGLKDIVEECNVQLPRSDTLPIHPTQAHVEALAKHYEQCIDVYKGTVPDASAITVWVQDTPEIVDAWKASNKAVNICLNSICSNPSGVSLKKVQLSSAMSDDLGVVLSTEVTEDKIQQFRSLTDPQFESQLGQPCKTALLSAIYYEELCRRGKTKEDGDRECLTKTASKCGLWHLNNVYLGGYWGGRKVLVFEREPKDSATKRKADASTPDDISLLTLDETVVDGFSGLGNARRSRETRNKKAEDVIDQAKVRVEQLLGNFDCRPLAYSAASVVDGFCGGILTNAFWIGLCWIVLSLLSLIGGVMAFKHFHHFHDREKFTDLDEVLNDEEGADVVESGEPGVEEMEKGIYTPAVQAQDQVTSRLEPIGPKDLTPMTAAELYYTQFTRN